MLRDKVLPCPYINPKLFYDVARLPQKIKRYESKNPKSKFMYKLHPINVRTNSRSSIITKRCVGYSFLVTTGKIFFHVFVSENIIGYKFGEFSNTRKRYYYRNRKKKKRKND